MPDQTVKVTFSPPSSWTFDQNPAHMSAAGKIILHRDPGDAAWTFVSANGLPAGYTSGLQGNGSQIAIEDPYGPPYNTPLAYSVTVSLNGTNYTSPPQTATQVAAGPPPIIVNDGTTGAR
jgi:hypothetical protein